MCTIGGMKFRAPPCISSPFLFLTESELYPFHLILRHVVAKLLHHRDKAHVVFGHQVKVKRKISAAGLEFAPWTFVRM